MSYWGQALPAILRSPFTQSGWFTSGENMAEGRGEGQVAIVEYREEAEGENPYLMLVKAAIVEEKQ